MMLSSTACPCGDTLVKLSKFGRPLSLTIHIRVSFKNQLKNPLAASGIGFAIESIESLKSNSSPM